MSSIKEKQQEYQALVNSFKKQQFSDPQLLNPFSIEGVKYDYKILNPWNLWHGNLNAEILLIGQDWGDLTAFKKIFTKDGWVPEKKNPTNEKLKELFSCIGYNIGAPDSFASLEYRYLPLFFTNAILGIKRHKEIEEKPVSAMSIKNDWFDEMGIYLIGLISIIEPKAIIVMGDPAYKLLQITYDYLPKFKYAGEAIDNNGKYPPINGSKVFRVAHCSALGLANRSMEKQRQDWKRINDLMVSNPFNK